MLIYRQRRRIYALIGCLLGIVFLEGGARLAERFFSFTPPDAASPLPFQFVVPRYIEKVEENGKILWWLNWVDHLDQWVEREKPKGQIRIVVLGASQAAAMGLSGNAGYAQKLEDVLRRNHPDRDIRVINFAKTGYASPQIAFIVRTTLQYLKPDLVLAIFGNNEQLDISARIQDGQVPPRLLGLNRTLKRHLAVARVFFPTKYRPLKKEDPGAKTIPPVEMNQAWTDFWTDRLMRSVVTIAVETRKAGGRLVVCNPPSNLFFIDQREWWWAVDLNKMTPEQYDTRLVRARFEMNYGDPEKALALLRDYQTDHDIAAIRVLAATALEKTGKNAAGEYRRALELLEKESELSPDKRVVIAALAYKGLGEKSKLAELAEDFLNTLKNVGGRETSAAVALRLAGDADRARSLLAQMRDEENLRIRATDITGRALKQAAARMNVPFYNLDKTLADTVPDGILDFDLFFDYCHFNPVGHLRLASLLLPIAEDALDLSRTSWDETAQEKKFLADLKSTESDSPFLSQWLGLGSCIWKLGDERLVREECTDKGEDLNSRCMEINKIFDKISSPADARKVMESYQSLLRIDPNYSPAIENIKFLRARYHY